MMDVNGTGFVVNNNVCFGAQGVQIPFIDGNCGTLVNSYQPTSYFDEACVYTCSVPHDPGLPPNSSIVTDLATTQSLPMASIRDSSGPRNDGTPPYGSFVKTPDPIVHEGLACYANCDGSTVAPVLNVNDYNCFMNRYNNRDPWANCDGSTTEPVLNVLDFNCFMTRYSAGCAL
jgi:hypothetical protein